MLRVVILKRIGYNTSRNMPFQGRPPVDEEQNIFNVSGSVDNGWTTVTFSRALDTGDSSNDFIFDGQMCAYFLYAWGGDVDTDGSISFHTDYEVSTVHFCFDNCYSQLPASLATGTTKTPTTTTPTRTLPPFPLFVVRVVGISFKLMDTWNEQYANSSTVEHLTLKNRVVSLVSFKTLHV